MYNSEDMCMDNELTFLSYNQCVNMEFTVDEIVNSGLWKVTTVRAGLLKAVPLFNCDKIVSSNPSDTVLDINKCLIVFDDTDTIVSVVSDDVGSLHLYSLQLYAYTPYSTLDVIDEVTVYCVVYDEYLNTVNNVLVNVLVDGDVVGQVRTDNTGLCKYTVSEPCEVSFCYNENLSNAITISGGE